MALIKFNQFEKAANLLEEYTLDELNQNPALTEGLETSLLEGVNSSLSKLDEGMFDWLKNWITKGIPGTIINKANKILDNYNKTKVDTLQRIGKERDKLYKAKIEADKAPEDKIKTSRFNELKARVDKAIAIIEDAEEDQTLAIKKQLDILGNKAKTDRVKTFISLKLAQIQEKIAHAKLEDAKKYADEAELKKLEGDLSDAKKEVKSQTDNLELAAKKDGVVEPAKEEKPGDKSNAPQVAKKEEPKAEEKPAEKKEEPKKEEPKENAEYKKFTKGSKWKYTSHKDGKTIIVTVDKDAEKDNDMVDVLGTKHNPFAVKLDQLKDAA